MDRWNLVIDWKKNTMEWQMGKRRISVTGVSDAQNSKIVSILFQQQVIGEEISVQQMKKLAKQEPMYWQWSEQWKKQKNSK